MGIEQYVHEHALTLCEKGNDGEILCYGCGNPFPVETESFYSYSCGECGFFSHRCFACDERASGSFYICKLCWPESPVFHKSCVDIPQKIQITYFPHCSFIFEEENSMIDMLDCDFCKETHKGQYFKFCCEACDIQIGFGCMAMLFKYHVGREHVVNFNHRHPLTLLEVDPDIDMNCMLCRINTDGRPIYGCVPCKFYIHNSSCLELPTEIRHPFHPRHSLTLRVDNRGRYQCEACCFSFQGPRYRCDECDFDLHFECASLQPNVKYKGHEHLLILVENMSYLSQCESCGFEIHGSMFIRCVECFLDFHVQCGPLPQPPTVLYEQHEHPLILSTFETNVKDYSHCNACKKERNSEHPFYCCAECEYFTHVRCAVNEVPHDDKGKFRHFSHPHILLIMKNNIDKPCYGCGKRFPGPEYGCSPCEFYLHTYCAELQREIYHPPHKHCFTLQESFTSAKGICNICQEHLNGFMYHCDICKFDIDVNCASTLPSINFKDDGGPLRVRSSSMPNSYKFNYIEGQEEIRYFCHQHPLALLFKVDDKKCELCYKSIRGQSYHCYDCKFYIHKSCGELLKEIRQPFHPRHSLKLRKANKTYKCDACCFNTEGLVYRCDVCFFWLHPECASLKPNIKYKGHQHLLTLVENMSNQSKCDACGFEIHGTSFARCVECRLNFHVQCDHSFPLLPTFVHKRHEHLLTPSTETAVKDDADHLLHREACVITDLQGDHEIKKLKHFSHRHSLLSLENKMNDVFICCACDKHIKSDLAYGCDPCKFYIHKICAELPREKRHPFHRHPLTLPEPYYRTHRECNACHRHCYGFTYSCQDCNFNLDLDCSLLHPSVKFENHEHVLTFFKMLHGTPECKRCKLTPPDVSYFRCVKCNFNVHFLCSPLPQTIKDDSHQHPVILKDNFVDLVDQCYDDVYYCDVCEIKRDARECVYYCEECCFVVDIDCVISEIICTLEGKRGDVQLRIVNHKRKGLTYKDIVESLTEEEKKIMESTLQDMQEEELKEINQVGDEANVIFSDILSRLNEEMLQSVTRKFSQGTLQLEELDAEDVEDELVNVGAYTIIPKYAPILKNLLHKYGDIGYSCTLTPGLKMTALVTVCAILHSMSKTKVMHMDNDSILKWCCRLKLVRRTGFKIDFVLNHLKRIVHARFVTSTELSRSSPLYKIHEEIAQLSYQIDDRMENIEKLRKRAQDLVSGHGSKQSKLEAQRLNEALELTRMTGVFGLL